MRRPTARSALAAALSSLVLLSGACGSGDPGRPQERAAGNVAEPVRLRLGYFPNLTHATAVAGVEKGIFAEKLGSGVELKTSVFNAGPAAVEALFSEALDAAYIGPNPSINAFAKSNGEAVRIVSGATSGGAFLVVKPGITGAAQLKGLTVATPQLGNTQDVALRTWMAAQKLKADTVGGDVHIAPQENAQALEAFKTGAIAGAWVPEPWATRMITEAGGKVLVDERSLWPDGQFVTTQLLVRTAYLRAHPDVVEKLVEGHLAATDYLTDNPAEARGVVNAGIAKLTGKALPENVLAAAWGNLTFTADPVAASLRQGAANAQAAGLLDRSVKLDGIYDLTILNRVLGRQARPPVNH